MRTQEELIEMAMRLPHKPEVNKSDWKSVNPNLLQILDYVVDFACDHDLPLCITSIIRPKIPNVSKTDIHADKRAFDLSTHGWTDVQVQKLVLLVNDKFNSVGAISQSDLKERAAVYEDGKTAGTAPHLHFQVRR